MSVNQNVLDAIDVLTTSMIKKAGYDRTIQAQIISCEDKIVGKYKCRYQDAIIYAYSNNISIIYKKNASVYILVPQGDMSKEKIILCTTNGLDIDYNVLASDFILIKRYTYDYTLAGNGRVNISGANLNTETPDGYKAVAFQRILTGSTEVNFRSMQADATGTSAVCSLQNLSENQKTGTLQVYIMYVRTRIAALATQSVGNARIFENTPTPPYDQGDLYLRDNSLYVSLYTREAGDTYHEEDWDLSEDYAE